MYNNIPNLASLISARICHDLANPIGAISNGMELMELSGAARTPEFDLTSGSVQNANAKLNFFRIAFGPVTSGELPPFEIARTLGEVFNSTRCQIEWQITTTINRQEAKRLFLLIQCLSSALPRGGTIAISRTGSQTTLSAYGDRIQCDGKLWEALVANTPNSIVKASDVHFELARLECDAGKKPITLSTTEQRAIITL